MAECYNRGSTKAKIKSKEKVKNHFGQADHYRAGGIIGNIHTIFKSRISNCYNTGNIRMDCEGPSQSVDGIAGRYHVWEGYARYNYNVGKVSMKYTVKLDKTKGSAIFGIVADVRMEKNDLRRIIIIRNRRLPTQNMRK